MSFCLKCFGTAFIPGDIGHPIHHLYTVDSTNALAVRLLAGNKPPPHGTLVVAEQQTAGRGRLGRKWISAPCLGLYFTVIIRPEIPSSLGPLMTLAAAVAAHESIERVTGLDVDIKWPNDLLVGNKKVCGILCELQAELDRVSSIAMGIGINVNQLEFPDEIAPIATSLSMASGRRQSRIELLLDFLATFERLYLRFLSVGAPVVTYAWTRASSFASGRRLEVQDGMRRIGWGDRGIGVAGRFAAPASGRECRSCVQWRCDFLGIRFSGSREGAGVLLAIDVGNTNTALGVYRDDRLIRNWRLSTERNRTVDEYGVLLRTLFSLDKLDVKAVRSVIVASVVPPLDWKVAEMVQRYFSLKAVFVTPDNAGIPILYDDPREVGADRIADAVAVLDRYSAPAIVVDLGTATTFNAITRKGEYQGGLIAPGIELSAATLIERAAKLPRIDIGRPRTLIGQSTAESMQSGFFWGYVSLVDGIVGRMIEELGEDTVVIATGGMARFIDGESKFITKIDENLTLDGLFLVGRRLGTI